MTISARLTAIPTGGPIGGRTNLDAIELSTGIVTHFGHIIPPPPVTYSCSVAPASGYPGDPITVTGTALNLNPKKTATYTWTSTGGVISGTSNDGEHRHQDRRSGNLHGLGSCDRGREAWPVGRLHSAVHGQAVRSADDEQLHGESVFGWLRWILNDYGERNQPAESSV